MRQLLEFAWNLNDVFKIHVLPWRLGLSSVSAKQTSLSLKSSLTFTPERPAGGSKSQLHANVYPWVWTMHLSLQESTPFLTEIQPKTCCEEEVGSGFAIGCCASCWWWVLQAEWLAWQNSTCAPLLTHLPAHHLLIFFSSFPELKRHQVGNTGNRCSRTALSWVASAVLCIPKISQEQSHARRFPHQGLAQQWCWTPAELIPSLLGCCQGMEPEPWSWPSTQKGTRWCTCAHRSSQSSWSILGSWAANVPRGVGSSNAVLVVWSLLVRQTRSSEPRRGKARGTYSDNNTLKRARFRWATQGWLGKRCIFLHYFFFFCNKTL